MAIAVDEAEYLPIHFDRTYSQYKSIPRKLCAVVPFFICAFNDDIVSFLNALQSSMTFCNDDNLCVHF